jgi:hypothetical protein
MNLALAFSTPCKLYNFGNLLLQLVSDIYKRKCSSVPRQMWWCIPVILALRRLKQGFKS